MNITIDMKEVQANIKKASPKVVKAAEDALRDTVVLIANDVINIHPWKTRTGNNSRSIKYMITQGGLGGAVYSTSGYGGFL